jgi:hypothetical protein
MSDDDDINMSDDDDIKPLKRAQRDRRHHARLLAQFADQVHAELATDKPVSQHQLDQLRDDHQDLRRDQTGGAGSRWSGSRTDR